MSDSDAATVRRFLVVPVLAMFQVTKPASLCVLATRASSEVDARRTLAVVLGITHTLEPLRSLLHFLCPERDQR